MNRLEEIQKRVKDYEAALHCGAGDIESALPQARMAIERYVYTDLKHLLAENTQLRAELEQSKADNAALIKAWEAIQDLTKNYEDKVNAQINGGMLCNREQAEYMVDNAMSEWKKAFSAAKEESE